MNALNFAARGQNLLELGTATGAVAMQRAILLGLRYADARIVLS
jgi:predicted O-methyltransferase YrrM